MQLSVRPGVTGGAPGGLVRSCIAAGAAAATVSVMSAPVPKVSDIASPPVALTAGWADVIAAAQANATDIGNHFSPAPFVALQQQIVNQIGYLQDLIRDPGDLPTVLSDISHKAAAVFGAPATGDTPADPGALFGPFLPDGGATDTVYQSLDDITRSTGTGLFDGLVFFTHDLLFQFLRTDGLASLLAALGLDDSALPLVQQLLAVAGSPLSGILIGELGTMLSPVLQFNDDVTAISDALSGATPDWTAALQTLADLPADITGAFLNGYGAVDLMPLLNGLGITLPTLDLLGQDSTIDGLGINLGGLLSAGGSLFAPVELAVTVGDLGSFDLPGIAVGPIASMVELGQAIAEALGWDGTGAPLDLMAGLL